MARTREFNKDTALNRAVELFWERGYANASMREMVKHTSVAHAGLYTAFGGKEDLFIAALQKYEQGIFTYLFRGLESDRASLKEIRKLFAFITVANDDIYFKHGCFIANTALEFGGKTGPVQDILNRTFARQVKAFEHALTNAVNNKEIQSMVNVSESASLLTILFYGCSSLTRMQASSETIKLAISTALHFIETPQ